MKAKYKRDVMKEDAQEKDWDDSRDKWLRCPDCGSIDAVIVSISWDAIAACPDCGYNEEIYSE